MHHCCGSRIVAPCTAKIPLTRPTCRLAGLSHQGRGGLLRSAKMLPDDFYSLQMEGPRTTGYPQSKHPIRACSILKGYANRLFWQVGISDAARLDRSGTGNTIIGIPGILRRAGTNPFCCPGRYIGIFDANRLRRSRTVGSRICRFGSPAPKRFTLGPSPKTDHIGILDHHGPWRGYHRCLHPTRVGKRTPAIRPSHRLAVIDRRMQGKIRYMLPVIDGSGPIGPHQRRHDRPGPVGFRRPGPGVRSAAVHPYLNPYPRA